MITSFIVATLLLYVTTYVVTVIHELGHYIMLRLLGFKVKTVCFSLGGGGGFTAKETRFVFGWIPVAGFVETGDDIPRGWRDSLIAAGGPLSVIIFTLCFCFCFYSIVGRYSSSARVEFASINTCLKSGDLVLNISGQDTYDDALRAASLMTTNENLVLVSRNNRNETVVCSNLLNHYFNNEVKFYAKKFVTTKNKNITSLMKSDAESIMRLAIGYTNKTKKNTLGHSKPKRHEFNIAYVLLGFILVSSFHVLSSVLHLTPSGDGGRIIWNLIFPTVYNNDFYLKNANRIEFAYQFLMTAVIIVVFVLMG